MPTSTSITTTYAGEKLEGYIRATLLTPNTIANGGITIVPNVKYKKVLKKLDLSDALAAGTCDFTDTGDVTLFERYLEPQEFQINKKLCKKDFRSDWDSIYMGYSVYDTLPPALVDHITAQHLAMVAESVERNFWNGQGQTIDGNGNATGNQFIGVLKRITDDITLNGVANTGTGNDVIGTNYLPDSETPIVVPTAETSHTAANVIAELQKVYDAIPQELFGKEDLKIFIPFATMKAYVQALGGFGLMANQNHQGIDNKGTMWYNNGGLDFLGVPIFVAQGLPAGKIIAGQSSNLHFAAGLIADMTELKVIDTSDTLGDQNVRFVLRFSADVNYAKGGELVYYTTA